MIGPSTSEVSDSFLYENAYGRPVGHLHNPAEREAYERIRRTTDCAGCGKRIIWAWLEGHRRKLDEQGRELDIKFDQKARVLRAVPGELYGLHRCER